MYHVPVYVLANESKLPFSKKNAVIDIVLFDLDYGIVDSTPLAKSFSNSVNHKNYFVKVNPLSPLFGHFQMSFEVSNNPSSSIEYILSIVGLGFNHGNLIYEFNQDQNTSESKWFRKNQRGINFGISYKWYLRHNQNKLRFVNSKLQSGFYFKPTIYFGKFVYDTYLNRQIFDPFQNSQLSFNDIEKQNQNVQFISLLLEPGFQFFVTNNFFIDFYAGLGYGYAKNNPTNDIYRFSLGYDELFDSGNLYSILKDRSSLGIAFSGGLKLGWNFSKSLVKNKN